MKMSTKLILFALVSVIYSWHYAIGGPTIVVPTNPIDVEKSADIIWNAVDRWGAKKGDINEVLCKIPYTQREQIAKLFEEKYGQSLRERLDEETSGDLKKLYRRLLESSGALLGNDLYDYIEGKRKDKYGAVTEIVCGTDAYDKSQLGAYYLATFKMDVMDHVKKYKAGDGGYQEVVFELCWRTYCIKPTLDEAKTLAFAQELKSIDCKVDGEKFLITLKRYFHTLCLPDLQAIFVNYRSLTNRGIDEAIGDAIQRENKEDEVKAYATLVLSIENRFRYYANLLHESVEGAGTDEIRIDRIVLTTCERYLGDIDNEYQAIHKESFYDRLSGWGGDLALSPNVKDCMKKLFGK